MNEEQFEKVHRAVLAATKRGTKVVAGRWSVEPNAGGEWRYRLGYADGNGTFHARPCACPMGILLVEEKAPATFADSRSLSAVGKAAAEVLGCSPHDVTAFTLGFDSRTPLDVERSCPWFMAGTRMRQRLIADGLMR